MSHTNHRRGDVKKRYYLGQQTGGFTIFSNRIVGPVSGESVAAHATVASESSKGVRRSRAGAKSFIATRFRRMEDQALNRNIRNGEYDAS